MNNLNNIPGEIIKTSQLPDDVPSHLIGVILGTSPKTVKYPTTLLAQQVSTLLTDVVKTTGSYSNPSWITSIDWSKLTNVPSFSTSLSSLSDVSLGLLSAGQLLQHNGTEWVNWTPNYLTTITGGQVTSALGYTPVTNARTLTINGATYDLSEDRSWTISTATPTLAQVTSAGNTTTNAITVNKLTVTGTGETYNMVVGSVSDVTNWNQFVSSEGSGEYGIYQDAFYFQAIGNLANGIRFFGNSTATPILQLFQSGNAGINTATDAGYRLDVNGTGRYQGAVTVYDNFNILRSTALNDVFNIYSSTNSGITTPGRGQFIIFHGGREVMRAYADRTTFVNGVVQIGTNTTPIAQLHVTGSFTASSAIARGVYFNNTLVAAANNDVLIGLDITPTFTPGAFTGTSSVALRVTAGEVRLPSLANIETTSMVYFDTTTGKLTYGAKPVTQLEKRSDYVESTSYCGTAPLGSAESATVWKIKKIVIASDGSTTTTTATNVAWTNRLTAIYI
jgi:hypothetical protein